MACSPKAYWSYDAVASKCSLQRLASAVSDSVSLQQLGQTAVKTAHLDVGLVVGNKVVPICSQINHRHALLQSHKVTVRVCEGVHQGCDLPAAPLHNVAGNLQGTMYMSSSLNTIVQMSRLPRKLPFSQPTS